mmetsp:Transcript_3740/g.10526  ORF Transcript_3740/g.10526 Transcript_3740/m.10526 type:complete len:472 (-) Transcript_3740:183-1598(-)
MSMERWFFSTHMMNLAICCGVRILRRPSVIPCDEPMCSCTRARSSLTTASLSTKISRSLRMASRSSWSFSDCSLVMPSSVASTSMRCVPALESRRCFFVSGPPSEGTLLAAARAADGPKASCTGVPGWRISSMQSRYSAMVSKRFRLWLTYFSIVAWISGVRRSTEGRLSSMCIWLSCWLSASLSTGVFALPGRATPPWPPAAATGVGGSAAICFSSASCSSLSCWICASSPDTYSFLRRRAMRALSALRCILWRSLDSLDMGVNPRPSPPPMPSSSLSAPESSSSSSSPLCPAAGAGAGRFSPALVPLEASAFAAVPEPLPLTCDCPPPPPVLPPPARALGTSLLSTPPSTAGAPTLVPGGSPSASRSPKGCAERIWPDSISGARAPPLGDSQPSGPGLMAFSPAAQMKQERRSSSTYSFTLDWSSALRPSMAASVESRRTILSGPVSAMTRWVDGRGGLERWLRRRLQG